MNNNNRFNKRLETIPNTILAKITRSQRNHICVSIMAWIVLKRAGKKTGKTLYQQKREPILEYLKGQWQNPSTVFC